jgi:hypothetical protein
MAKGGGPGELSCGVEAVYCKNAWWLLLFLTEDVAKLSVTDPRSILHHGRKHRLKIAAGAADYLEHLRRSSLLLQCLVALARQQRNLLVYATNGRRAATRDLWRIAVL